MILRDDAIVLRVYPYGNTSRIVVWLSPLHGKLATLAKGSQRYRSVLLGQMDLFYTCEILFYARESRQLHILKECAPLETRSTLRGDWRACAVASYIAGVVDQVTPVGAAAAHLHPLLAESLDSLARKSPGPAFIPRFELQLLRELGLAPNWQACARCWAELKDATPGYFNEPQGAIYCAGCADGQGMRVSAATRKAIQALESGQALTSLPESVFREMRDVMGGLLRYHGDIADHGRRVAFQILAAG